MKNSKLKGYILAALFSVFITLCAWIQFPLAVPITLQTFGVFLSLLVLGGYYGTISVLAYISLGLIGLPVFSGFQGGFSALLGAGGGYIIGFLALALIYWFFEKVFSKKIADYVGLTLGLVVCYLLGASWYSEVYAASGKTFLTSLAMLTAIYIIPDAIKLILALIIKGKILAHLQKIK